MSTRRRIVAAGLDSSVRSILNQCPLFDPFGISGFDENTSVASAAPCRPGDLPLAVGLGAEPDARREVSLAHRRKGAAVVFRGTKCRSSLQATAQGRARKISMPFDTGELCEKLNGLA